MFNYEPPGALDDLSGRPTQQAFLEDWHQFIKGEFDANISEVMPPGGTSLFFTETKTAATSAEVPVTWDAFPLALVRVHQQDPPAAWVDADVLRSTTIFTAPGAPTFTANFRLQDEYCEWHLYRDTATNKITRIVLTAEGPEYWIRLAQHDFDKVLALYRKYVSPNVQKAELQLSVPIKFGNDILPQGSYNPFNIWNTEKGVMHLTHPANTLGAEINLAARATTLRKAKDGKRITESRPLICCSGYGSANRSSDPSIGQGVNLTVLPPQAGAQPVRITLANPVGLYINKITDGALTDDEGNPLDDWFRFERGVVGRGLMAIVEPPSGAKIDFDKVQVKGVALTRGGQLAEVLQMVLYARTALFAGAAPSLQFCEDHCCMAKGTPIGKIKDVNISQIPVQDKCGPSNEVEDAFPEIVPDVIPAGLVPAGASTEPRAGKSRLANW